MLAEYTISSLFQIERIARCHTYGHSKQLHVHCQPKKCGSLAHNCGFQSAPRGGTSTCRPLSFCLKTLQSRTFHIIVFTCFVTYESCGQRIERLLRTSGEVLVIHMVAAFLTFPIFAAKLVCTQYFLLLLLEPK